MRTLVTCLAALLLALPAYAQSAHTVAARCELLAADVTSAGKDAEFLISVTNISSRPLMVPRAPQFSWQLQTMKSGNWRLRAEGGPIRRLDETHVTVPSGAAAEELISLTPGSSLTFRRSIPEAMAAMVPKADFETVRLTLLWAASPELLHGNRQALRCAIAPEMVVNLLRQKP
jgi:hypothetical protein